MQDTSGFHDGTSGGEILPALEIAKESLAMTVVRKVTTKRKAVRICLLSVVGSHYWIAISPKFRPFPVEIV